MYERRNLDPRGRFRNREYLKCAAFVMTASWPEPPWPLFWPWQPVPMRLPPEARLLPTNPPKSPRRPSPRPKRLDAGRHRHGRGHHRPTGAPAETGTVPTPAAAAPAAVTARGSACSCQRDRRARSVRIARSGRSADRREDSRPAGRQDRQDLRQQEGACRRRGVLPEAQPGAPVAREGRRQRPRQGGHRAHCAQPIPTAST